MADEKALEDIKRLLILLLIKLDATSEELAVALQIDSSVVRRMIPSRKVRRVVKAIEE
jgi:hypothetical protein